ncbi:uncharacterized protein LOC101848334 isoform X2 [Aplysia californica]|nr:uncharacterized protein LOC101848334 isoform X2 [Aplysia californica]
MVQQCSRDLQTSTLALLTFSPEKFEVSYQGSEDSVKDAESHVECILSKLRGDGETILDKQEQENIENEKLNVQRANRKDIMAPAVSESSSGLCERNSDASRKSVSVMGSGTSEDSTNGEEISNRDYHLGVCQENTSSALRISDSLKSSGSVSVSSFSSTCSSDEESGEEDNVLTDLRYSKQVEQAVKLGYSEQHVKKALSKLGLDCGLDDLLRELITIGAEEKDVAVISSSDGNQCEAGKPDPGALLGFSSTSTSGPGDVSGISAKDSVQRNSSFDYNDSSNLRQIIIDGSNVAMSHGKTVFSCKGIKLAVDWFRERGHKDIIAFVPQWRKETSRPDAPITDQEILTELEKERVVVFTPSRRIKGKRVVCYDDRYVLKLALDTEGIVVSNDIYRDLCSENEDFRKVVEQRLLMYSFADDRFMPPEDPYGRGGISLDNLLRKVPMQLAFKPQECPYGRKCTYGNKCRFFHPERGYTPQRSVTEALKEQAEHTMLEIKERAAEKGRRPKQKLVRTKSFVPETRPLNPSAFDGDAQKPKLNHSKSLVALSPKSADYLNEPRRKMESELSAAFEKMPLKQRHSASSMGSSFFSTPKDLGKPQSVFEDPVPQANSPRSSPLPEREVVKQFGAGGAAVPASSSPMKNVVSVSQRASPSHLTVPKHEQSEPYLSGHLLVAKKLSDEGKNDFFSEHVSSPSSTRTSSPVVPLGKGGEQRNLGMSDSLSRESLLDASSAHPHGAFSNTTENLPNLSLFHSGEATSLSQSSLPGSSSEDRASLEMLQRAGSDMYPPHSGTFQEDDNLPELSIFHRSGDASGMSSPSSRTFSSAGNLRQHNDESSRCQDFATSPNVFSPVIDSGNFSGSETQPSPVTSRQSYFQKMSGEPGTSEPPSLRRAFSSTGNVFGSAVSSEGQHVSGPHTGRLSEHLTLKPQHSVPLGQKPQLRRQSNHFEFSRQNSSSDPQIHQHSYGVGGRDVSDQLPVGLSPYPGGDRSPGPGMFSPQAAVELGSNALPLPQQQQQQQFYYPPQQHLQRSLQPQHTDSQSRRAVHRQSVSEVVWGEPVLGMYPPVSSGLHRTPYPLNCVDGGVKTASLTPYPQSTSDLSAYSQQQHPARASFPLPMQQYGHAPLPSSHFRQQLPPHQLTHSQPPFMPHSNPAAPFSFPNPSQPPPPPQTGYPPPYHSSSSGYAIPPDMSSAVSSPYFQPMHTQAPPPNVMPTIHPEDTPILQCDQERYLLYHRLIPLFGEAAVRKVMNKHPRILNPEDLCPLIIAFKQETRL